MGSLNLLNKTSSAFMLSPFEMLPLRLHRDIILQLRVGLRHLDAEITEDPQHAADKDRVYPSALIFLLNSDQIEIDAVIGFERAHQME